MMQHFLLQKVKHAFALTMAFLFVSAGGFAQAIAVKGKVTNNMAEPMPNASILIKGTTTGVTTGENGTFSINVPNTRSVLVISAIGHQTKEITVGNQTNIDVVLLAGESSELDAVVVVGYGTQKKVTVTGAVAQVKGSELQKSPAVNLSNSLAGRLPGITAMNGSGEPGYDGSTIRIRGTNTLGNSSALIVIDGVPERSGGLDRINPADIESMSVLKDASAAIYGARAANGVILITTKHGKSGKPRLSYDFNQGWAQPTRIPEMSDAVEYGTIRNESQIFENVPADQWDAAWQALTTTGTYTRTDNGAEVKSPAGFAPEDMQKYKDGSDPWGHPNTDWFGDALKKWSPQQKHNVQVNGGSENVKYFASLGYQNQDGYYKNSATGYKQYDLRFNLDANINKYIRASIGVNAREEFRFFPTKGAGAIFRMLMRGKPNEPEIWPNGLPGRDIENGENPIVITTNVTGYDKDKRDYFQTNGKVEIDIPGVQGLKITGTAALDKYMYEGKRWETPWYLYSWDRVSYETDGVTPQLTKELRSTFTDPRLRQNSETSLNILLGALLNYDRTFGDHTFNFLAGINRETVNGETFNAYRRYFISNAVDQMFAGGDAEKNNGGGGYQRARLSYFGRVGYNFQEKYMAEFLWRYDGSYMFPEQSRFGFFPGILAGWRISEENFFKDNVNIINSLKLRASYGQMGNDQVYFNGALQEYQYLATYGFDRTYIIDDQLAKAIYERRVPNYDFTWEVANNLNVGLEGTLWNNKINFEFDYFYNKRDQISIQKQGSTPSSSGISSLLPPVNLGKVDNKGWEFKVGYNGQAGDFTYSVSINGGYAKNKVIFWDEPPSGPAWQRSTGHSIGSNGYAFLALQYDGVFKDQKDIDANTINYSPIGGTNLRPGDMKFVDVDGNDTINANDRIRMDKNRDPTFTGGININIGYKNFDLSILFQGATGGLLFFGTESGDIGNYLQYSYDHRWSIENPSSTDPRLANRGNTYYAGGTGGANTYWLRSSNYLRLKNIEIGYNLSPEIGKRVGISNFRVYANGLNLITWDKMKIWDPESTSGSGQYYPQARLLNLGFRVTF
ncbi:SusC/RagA family TonB-linked outer membrane protein [Agriterribacter humi]|uniref:SusC/RagA family TonB-linked outer membrane protein n=1 Tax=Agriterribacter humi TaxID=1104781 RepID=UPI00293BB097|nr:TonB-dependent receptor [Agriterribacter humi]